MQFSKNYKDKLFSVNSTNFEQFALELFNYQAKYTPVYRDFINYLNIDIENIEFSQIPFIPIEFFKNHEIICDNLSAEKVFESSGTSGITTSKHYFHDVSFYLENCREIFTNFYGDIREYAVFALLPSYIERGTSSLTSMVSDFIEKSESSFSGFYLNNYQELISNIKEALTKGEKVLLIGVTFALLDLAELYPTDLSSIIMMETGGMKGRRDEMTRDEVHTVLRDSFNLNLIHSEYGMTELSSQAYSSGNGVFETPPWMKVRLREMNDPLSSVSFRKSGAIDVIDLANVDSCAFIATQDLGRRVGKNRIEVLGRIDNSDIRGCNLLVLE